MDSAYFEVRKQKALEIYAKQRTIFSPYFNLDIVLNSNGFHHLQFSARSERPKEAQLLKFTLLPLGLDIIKQTTTLQESRKLLSPVGKKSKGDGLRATKLVEWWGFIAIFVEQDIKVKVVLRRVGSGNITFWSVMPYTKFRKDRTQKLFTDGIEDE